jgi:signal peptidase I
MLFEREVIQLLQQTLSRQGVIELPCQGDSMYPLIQKGDICEFTRCEASSIHKGDILLFWSLSGQLVVHRFYERKIISGEEVFLCKGDSNLGFDQPINRERILGKVSVIKRHKRRIVPDNLQAMIWGRLLFTLPVLSGMLRTYLNKKYS